MKQEAPGTTRKKMEVPKSKHPSDHEQGEQNCKGNSLQGIFTALAVGSGDRSGGEKNGSQSEHVIRRKVAEKSW